MVRLVFLGKFADWAGRGESDLSAPLNWHGLLDEVDQRIADALRDDKAHIAVNGVILSDKAELVAQDGDEVALLPPVSGG